MKDDAPTPEERRNKAVTALEGILADLRASRGIWDFRVDINNHLGSDADDHGWLRYTPTGTYDISIRIASVIKP